MTMITIDSYLAGNIVMAMTSVTIVFGYFFYRIMSKTLDHRFSMERTDQYASIFKKNRTWFSNLFSTVESHIYRYSMVSVILPKIMDMIYVAMDMMKFKSQCSYPTEPFLYPAINNPFMGTDRIYPASVFNEVGCPATCFYEPTKYPTECPCAVDFKCPCPCPMIDNPFICPQEIKIGDNIVKHKGKKRGRKVNKHRVANKRPQKRDRNLFENNFNELNYSDAPIFTEAAAPEKKPTKDDSSDLMNLIGNVLNKNTDTAPIFGQLMKLLQPTMSCPSDANVISKDAISNLFNGHRSTKKEPTPSPVSEGSIPDSTFIFQMASSFDRATRICDIDEYETLSMEDVNKRFYDLANKLGVEKTADLSSFKFDNFLRADDSVADFIRLMYFQMVGRDVFLANYKKYISQSKSNDVILTECLDDLEN
uniref:Uncharacterized protein n=1 Tax=viral metagenome TaxID=1070528 RepID=A0A6C0CBQ8_9ZZZZ